MRPSTASAALLWLISPLICNAAVVTTSLSITRGTATPDGISRPAFLFNNQMPGPVITANEGDRLEVTVTNNSPNETSVHWHGIEQLGTMWSDGAPGITQRSIKPGKTFLYNFTATTSGIYWYHSHSKHQLADGMRGMLYIKPKSTAQKPFSLISSVAADITAMNAAESASFFMNTHDWSHSTAEQLEAEWTRTSVEQLCADSIVINGKGQGVCPIPAITTPIIKPPVGKITAKGCAYPNNTLLFPFSGSKPDIVNPTIWYDCHNTSSALEVFSVSPSAKYAAFHVVNSGSLWDLRISIDSHNLIVFAADGAYVNPQTVKAVTMGIGQRYSFFVRLDQPVADYTIRVAADVLPQMLSGYAVLSYAASTKTRALSPRAATTTPVAKNAWMDYAGNMINGGADLLASSLDPFPAKLPPQGAAGKTIFLSISRPSERQWILNNVVWPEPAPLSTPLLFQPNLTSLLDPNLYFTYANGTVVDIIVQVNSGNPALHPPHPIHKHGARAWHLGTGQGAFPYASVQAAINAGFTGLDLTNPPTRDTFPTPPGTGGVAWSVFRFQAVSPSVTLLHCHIDPHIDSGMTVVLMEGMDKIGPIPSYYLQQT